MKFLCQYEARGRQARIYCAADETYRLETISRSGLRRYASFPLKTAISAVERAAQYFCETGQTLPAADNL